MVNYTWDFDVTKAPRDGTRVILASKCGKVISSEWLPADPEGKIRTIPRWQMFHTNEEPIAWMPYPTYPRKENDS